MKNNYIYKNQYGEYFKSIKKDGKIVLQNPSYPFVFLPEVQEPLIGIGEAKQFEHLIKKESYEFHKGNTLNVEIDKKGNLKVKK